MRKIFSVLVFFYASGVLAQTANPRATTVIDKNRQGLRVVLTNPSESDFVCQVTIDAKVCDDNFCQSVGHLNIPFQNLYLRQQANLKFVVGKSELAEIHRDNSSAIVTDAKTDISCEVAGFADFCRYAEKNEKEDLTLAAIAKEARTENCDKIEKEVGSSLDLDRTKIENLKPVGMLGGLKSLSLNDNQIESIDELGKLKNLADLKLKENPIRFASRLFELPKLKRLYLSRTPLQSIAGIEKARSLKEIDIEDTSVQSLAPLLNSTVTCAHYKNTRAKDTEVVQAQLYERFVAGGSCW
jgi:hypothetical protein